MSFKQKKLKRGLTPAVAILLIVVLLVTGIALTFALLQQKITNFGIVELHGIDSYEDTNKDGLFDEVTVLISNVGNVKAVVTGGELFLGNKYVFWQVTGEREVHPGETIKFTFIAPSRIHQIPPTTLFSMRIHFEGNFYRVLTDQLAPAIFLSDLDVFFDPLDGLWGMIDPTSESLSREGYWYKIPSLLYSLNLTLSSGTRQGFQRSNDTLPHNATDPTLTMFNSPETFDLLLTTENVFLNIPMRLKNAPTNSSWNVSLYFATFNSSGNVVLHSSSPDAGTGWIKLGTMTLNATWQVFTISKDELATIISSYGLAIGNGPSEVRFLAYFYVSFVAPSGAWGSTFDLQMAPMYVSTEL